MDNDDIQIGRLLSRSEMLVLLGGASAAVVIAGCASGDSSPTATATAGRTNTAQPTAGSTQAATAAAASTAEVAAPSCIVRPEETEGPYFVDEKINRSDIRTNTSDGKASEGTPLVLTFNVANVGSGSCTSLAGATIDVWHCDAAGVYSDVTDRSFNTVGQDFLRGYQVTDASGQAKFTTIYPGWYQGRTVHIHFKIRATNAAGKAVEFTSQLFFDEDLTDEAYAVQPYLAKGERTLRNNGDGIYNDQLLLDVSKSGAGYAATFDIGLDMA